MQLSVDPIQRNAKMRAHTATHLLHAQLAAIFPQTKQAGSLVDEDYLRFDFYADTALSDQQVQDIQSYINTQIAQALPVNIQEMSYTDATQSWAKAFFEDKYGDTVRVVTIGDKVSVELCGWTHVSNTAHIGAFAIISQESVAAGIKRITAVTGPKVAEELIRKKIEIKNAAQRFGVQEQQIMSAIESNVKERIDLEIKVMKLETRILKDIIGSISEKSLDGMSVYKIPEDVDIKRAVWIWKDEERSIVIYNKEWSFAILSPLSKAKSFAQSHWLKGGGSDTFFQWKDPKILEIV